MSKKNRTDAEWEEIYEEIYQQDERRKILAEMMREDAMMHDPYYYDHPPE